MTARTSIHRPAALLTLVVFTLLMPMAACTSNPSQGYSSGAMYSSKFRSVAVPLFKNNGTDRAVQFQLGDALVKEFEQMTPYKVTSEGRADTVLRGTIRAVTMNMVSQSLGTGLPEEMAFGVTVDFEWLDMKTGKPIVSRAGFKSTAVFVASLPNKQPIDLARFAVAQQMARDIVASLQGDW
jgi:hypothetical protein